MTHYIIQIGKSYWDDKKKTYVGNKSVATKFDYLSAVGECLKELEENEKYINMGIKVFKIVEEEVALPKQEYKPTCQHGYTNCIHDPAYTLYNYDRGYCSWVRERYTREELEEAVLEGCECENGWDYDDEDK